MNNDDLRKWLADQISYLEKTKSEPDKFAWDPEYDLQLAAFRLALERLEPVGPLTLEQLREMEGQKVLLYRIRSTEPLEPGTVKQNGDVLGDAGMLAYHELYLETWVAFTYNTAHIDREAWVSVSERMPDEHDSIFKKLIAKEKWGAGMFERLSDDVIVAIKFADGTRRSGFAHTKDGVWMGLPSIGCPVVTHWMPMPEPPEREG